MKKYFLPFIILLSFFCHSQTSKTVLTAEEFEKGINQSNIQVLDVRTAGEYRNGHIKNSLHADWLDKVQFKERTSYIDKDKSVYIYCLSGARSEAAAEWLRKNGYSEVLELSGGINAWKKNKKELEGSSNEKQMSLDEYNSMLRSDAVLLVDFGAKWCPPCVKMEPVLTELENDKMVSYKFIKIDAGIHTDIQKELNIETLPVFIIYKNGKEVWRKQGLVTKNEFIEQLK
jgi:rhodanese-related sulfurtransferase